MRERYHSTIAKKGDLSYSNDNRGITLLDISGKAFFIILLLRDKDEVDVKMRENQAGFRKGRLLSRSDLQPQADH